MGKIFISYRREDSNFAQGVAAAFRQGVFGKIFIDHQHNSYNWAGLIERDIQDSAIFVLCVTENTFAPDRIQMETDWLRVEIAAALRHKKPIVLVLDDGYPPPPANQLPQDIQQVSYMKGISLYRGYEGNGLLKLVKYCVKIAEGDLRRKRRTKRESKAKRNAGI